MKLDSVFREKPINPTPSFTSGNTRETKESNDTKFIGPLDKDYSLANSISDKESGGDYGATNPNSSAAGKYQFLWNTWKDKITKVTGIQTKDEFLKAPQSQEHFYKWYEQNHLLPETKKIREQGLGSNLTDQQLGKLIHYRGDKGAKDYLQGKLSDKPESYNMSISKYIFAYGGDLIPQPVPKKPIVPNPALIPRGTGKGLDDLAPQAASNIGTDFTRNWARQRAESGFMGLKPSDALNIPDATVLPQTTIQKQWESNPANIATYGNRQAGGYYSPDVNKSVVQLEAPNSRIKTNSTHEATHAWQNQIENNNPNNPNSPIATSYKNIANEITASAKPEDKYYGRADEVHARVMEGRGILNLKPEQEVTQDHLDILKVIDKRKYDELDKVLTDQGKINVFNKTVMNNKPTSNTVQFAMYGGNLRKYGIGGFLETNGSAIGQIGTQLGTVLGNGDSVGDKVTGGIVSGAASGAALGPVGIGVGALIGGVSGLVNAQAIKRQKQQANLERQAQLNKQMQDYSRQNLALNNMPQLQSYFAYGGGIPQYEVEHNEVVQGNDVQLEDGKQLASDLHHVLGNRHEDGGTKGIGGDRVFSDRIVLSARNKERLNDLGIKTKGTVAKIARNIATMKGKMEAKLSSNDPITKATGMLMANRANDALEMLYNQQEEQKQEAVFGYGGYLPSYGDGGNLPGTEAVRNYQIYLNKKFGSNLDVTGKWDSNTQNAYTKTGKIDYKSNKKQILETINKQSTDKQTDKVLPKAESIKKTYLEDSTNEKEFTKEFLSRLKLSDNTQRSVTGKTLKDTFSNIRESLLNGAGDKELVDRGPNGLADIEKHYYDLSDQYTDNVRRINKSKDQLKKLADGGPIDFNRKWGFNAGTVNGSTPQIPKFKYKSKPSKPGIANVSKKAPGTTAPALPTKPNIATPAMASYTTPLSGALSTDLVKPVATTPTGPTNVINPTNADSNKLDSAMPYIATGLAAIGQASTVSKIKTRPEVNLVNSPSYSYQDRSQPQLRDIDEEYQSVVLPDRLKGQAFTDRLKARGTVYNQENQRRDQYNAQFSQEAFRSNAINSSVLNQANQTDLNNQNVKTQLMGEVAQGTLQNVNTIQAEKEKKKLDAKRLAYLTSSYQYGRTKDLGKEELEKLSALFGSPGAR